MKVIRKSTGKGNIECSNLVDATNDPPREDGEVITSADGTFLAAENGHTGWSFTKEGAAEIARIAGGMISPS